MDPGTDRGMLYTGIVLVLLGLVLGLLGGPILFALVIVGLVLVGVSIARGRSADATAPR